MPCDDLMKLPIVGQHPASIHAKQHFWRIGIQTNQVSKDQFSLKTIRQHLPDPLVLLQDKSIVTFWEGIYERHLIVIIPASFTNTLLDMYC